MEAFALYLLKSIVWIAGFALVFFLFLRNERFFLLNRIYLISGILTSFFFPLISIHYIVVLPVVRDIQVGSAVISEIQNAGNSIIPDLKLILLILYVLGVLFVLTLIMRQGRSVLRSIKKCEIISSHPVKLIRTPEYTSAFSFFSYVFVNPSITDVETKEIINHELVHIRQKHWVDLVLVELLCMMQWFNPLVWIYVRFIRQNHEYLADEVALQRTSDPAVYRAALLNQIVGAPVVSLTNSFNYSLNKKRFNMMKNIISSPYRKMKILLILPVFAIVLYAFAKPDYRYKYADTGSGPGITGTSTQQKEVKGTVVQQDGKPLQGASVTVVNTFLGVSTDAKGFFKLGNIPDDGLLSVSYVGYKSKVLKPDFTSEMTISMIRDTVKYLNSIMGTMPPPPPPPPPADAAGEMNAPPPPPPPSDLTFKSEIGGNPLVVIDGSIKDIDVKKIDPETIGFINVLKDKSATDKYGEKGKDGVVEITTKEKVGRLLVVIDGVLHEKDGMSKIQLDDIKTMNVLAEKPAIEKYGEKGKNGAIEITLYKNGDEKPDFKIVPKSQGDPKTDREPVEIIQTVPKPGKDVFVVVEEMPEFPGGKDAIPAWIAANLKYPAKAVKENITGRVIIDFMVSGTGKVKNVTVVKSVNPLLDAEAIRVISSMPDWKAAMQAGKPVDVQVRVPVNFSLK